MGSTTKSLPSKVHKNQPRWRRWLPWVAGLVLGVGLIAVLVTFWGNTADSKHETFSNKPAVDVTKPVKSVPVPAEVKTIAKTFIETAVARKNLEQAYDLVGPAIKQGMSLAEWKTGNIAVVPFPMDKLEVAPFKVDYSHENDVLMEVALLAKQGSGVKSQLFFIQIQKFGKGDAAHWLVNSWVPRGSAPVPDGTFRGG